MLGRRVPSPTPGSRRKMRSTSLTFGQPVAQTLWPDIGPRVFDVVQTRGSVRLAEHHTPSVRNIGKGRPQAVLFLVVDQHEEAAVIVVERISSQYAPQKN